MPIQKHVTPFLHKYASRTAQNQTQSCPRPGMTKPCETRQASKTCYDSDKITQLLPADATVFECAQNGMGQSSLPGTLSTAFFAHPSYNIDGPSDAPFRWTSIGKFNDI